MVFAPKYRGQAIYGDIRKDIGVILRKLCEQKKVEIREAELCRDHIHMLVSIPPNLKYKYGNRHFWCRGYYVDTVGKYEGAIKEYIRNQLKDDIANDQISLKEFTDPFTGEPVKPGK